MWWNVVVGTSMLASSISTMIGNISTIAMNTINASNGIESTSNNNVFKNTRDFNMIRVSKYPSKTTIGFF